MNILKRIVSFFAGIICLFYMSLVLFSDEPILIEDILQFIPNVLFFLLILIALGVGGGFLYKQYKKKKYLMEYGFPATARVVKIEKTSFQVNNQQLLNVTVEFNGHRAMLKYQQPSKFTAKENDSIRIKYNSQNPEEIMWIPDPEPPRNN